MSQGILWLTLCVPIPTITSLNGLQLPDCDARQIWAQCLTHKWAIRARQIAPSPFRTRQPDHLLFGPLWKTNQFSQSLRPKVSSCTAENMKPKQSKAKTPEPTTTAQAPKQQLLQSTSHPVLPPSTPRPFPVPRAWPCSTSCARWRPSFRCAARRRSSARTAPAALSATERPLSSATCTEGMARKAETEAWSPAGRPETPKNRPPKKGKPKGSCCFVCFLRGRLVVVPWDFLVFHGLKILNRPDAHWGVV